MELTYARLSQWNPPIVCYSLNGFGSGGPRASEPGYDYLMQAYAGYMSIMYPEARIEQIPARRGDLTEIFIGGLVL